MRLLTLLLSLVPGAAHIELGRAWRGLLYFFLFAFLVNGALVAPLVTGHRAARTACALGAAGVWILAFYGAVRTAARTRSGAVPGPRTPAAAPSEGDPQGAGVAREKHS